MLDLIDLKKVQIKQAETNFQERYNQTKASTLPKLLRKVTQEAQLISQEQMADMRSAFRFNNYKEKQRQSSSSITNSR